MDLPIKSEPDMFEDTMSQSAEFLDENPCERNMSVISETNVDRNLMDTVLKYPINSAVKKRQKITSHWRKKCLLAFQREGCSRKTVTKLSDIHDLSEGKLIEVFNKAANEAQNYVHEECDSLSFNNITEWLKYFKSAELSKQCNYEAAIVLNAIANNEYHPKPECMDGINLREIYKFLSNALMGLPQQQLDEESAKFLSNEFQNLINEANTDEADDDVRNMKSKIEDSLYSKMNGKSYKLDPLNTNTKELERCYGSFKKI